MYSQDVLNIAKDLYENKRLKVKEIANLLSISTRVFSIWKKKGFKLSEHSTFINYKNKQERKEKVLRTISENPFLNQREIAKLCNVSQMTVCRYFKEEKIALKK